MNTKIYVDNLDVATTEKELMDLFSVYGNVVTIHIAVNRTHASPHSIGFVTMVTPEGARSAIQALNGREIGLNTLALSEGWEKSGSPRNGTGIPRRRPSQLY